MGEKTKEGQQSLLATLFSHHITVFAPSVFAQGGGRKRTIVPEISKEERGGGGRGKLFDRFWTFNAKSIGEVS